jgi:hypothetical protein
VTVDGGRAAWSRSLDHELTVTPQRHLKKGHRFVTVVRYDGVPRTQQLIVGPMASYLASATVGQFRLRSYRTPEGLRLYDAVDPDLYSEAVDPQNPSSPTYGQIVDGSFARQGEILRFLASQFGRYPFSTGGGVVDDYDNLLFALENQTRTVYSKFFFTDPSPTSRGTFAAP